MKWFGAGAHFGRVTPGPRRYEVIVTAIGLGETSRRYPQRLDQMRVSLRAVLSQTAEPLTLRESLVALILLAAALVLAFHSGLAPGARVANTSATYREAVIYGFPPNFREDNTWLFDATPFLL